MSDVPGVEFCDSIDFSDLESDLIDDMCARHAISYNTGKQASQVQPRNSDYHCLCESILLEDRQFSPNPIDKRDFSQEAHC